MQIKKKGQEGFTLIELLVVVVIIGILASVAVPNFMGAQDKAKNSGVQSNAHTVQMALEQYAVDNSGSYPANLGSIGSGYLAGDTYPATPWGTQQASASNIPVPAATQTTVNSVLGATGAKGAAPTTWTHFGAVHYTRSGAADERYELSATGKKGQGAITATYMKNY